MFTNFQLDPRITELAGRTRELVEDAVPNLPFGDSKHLGGACGFASYILARALKGLGIPASLVIGSYEQITHAWVEVDVGVTVDNGTASDPVIVDITFTQFGRHSPDPVDYPRVFIAPASKSPKHLGTMDDDLAERDLARWGCYGPLHEQTVPFVNRILADLGAPQVSVPRRATPPKEDLRQEWKARVRREIAEYGSSPSYVERPATRSRWIECTVPKELLA